MTKQIEAFLEAFSGALFGLKPVIKHLPDI